jgi:hypothetical protein
VTQKLRRSRRYDWWSGRELPCSTRGPAGKLIFISGSSNAGTRGHLPDTRPFLLKSSLDRAVRKTSASSNSSTQPHRLARLNEVSSAFSTSGAVVPKSPTTQRREISVLRKHIEHYVFNAPQVIWYRGFPNICATPSVKTPSVSRTQYKLDAFRGRLLPAVVVFPTPGAPCKRMISPFPVMM